MTVVATLCLVAAARPAAAHVVPSVDDNNRYLKLTPLGDRVRLAYTVFFGDNPGRGERQTIDTNHDGAISEDEAHAFGTNLAATVAAALDLEVDGHTEPVTWAVVDVGMGTPAVSGGSFSVDLVAYACFATPRGAHALRLKDRFRVPRPGETEIKVEDSPGITIDRARVGAADAPDFDYKFVGPGGPLSDDGLELKVTASDAAIVANDGVCTGGSGGNGGHGANRPRSSLAIAIGGVTGGLAAAGALAWWWRRRARPNKPA